MLFKVHKATRLAVAVCDSNLIGKRFEEKERQLDLTGKFFQGEEKTEEEIRDLIEFYRNEDACFNIVGEESCRIALEVGLILEEGMSKVDGVPFSLVLG
jgi:uncharacterized protein